MIAGLPVALVPIYAVVFLDVLGLTFLIPLLPALAQRFHSNAATMGFALSTAALCAALSSPFWGALSDRVGRRNVLAASQAFSFAGYALLAVAGSVPLLFVSRAIEGFGGGNIGVAQAYIADLTAAADRQRAYAFGAAAFGIGFVVGPVAAGQLLRFGFAVPLWTAAGLQMATLFVTVLLLDATSSAGFRAPKARDVATELRRPAMRRLFVRQFLYIFSFTYFFTIFSLYLDRAFGLDAQRSSLLLAAAGAVGALAQLFVAPPLTRRYGPRAVTQGAFACACVAYAALAFVGSSVATFLVILACWAASGALLQPALTTLLSDEAPGDRRGAILGLADALGNASMIVAPATAGIVLGASPAYIGILPAAATALGFVLGVAPGRRR